MFVVLEASQSAEWPFRWKQLDRLIALQQQQIVEQFLPRVIYIRVTKKKLNWETTSLAKKDSSSLEKRREKNKIPFLQACQYKPLLLATCIFSNVEGKGEEAPASDFFLQALFKCQIM
jgi:hypothetical protein